jgi:hypothetical protein
MTENLHFRIAWIALVVLGSLEVLFSVSLAFQGPAAVDNSNLELQGAVWSDIAAHSNEAGLIDYFARSWGAAEAFVAVTIVVIAAIPFRGGQRWSWYFLWLVPVLALVAVIRNYSAGIMSVAYIDLPEGLIFSLLLLLSHARFFPGS